MSDVAGLIFVAIIFPPAAVACISGWSGDLLLNVILTFFFYIPGHLHAFYIIYARAQTEASVAMNTVGVAMEEGAKAEADAQSLSSAYGA